MDELDRNLFNTYKECVRKVQKNIANDDLEWGYFPIVLVDYKNWECKFFKKEYDAEEYLTKKYSSWDDSPPEGDDEELIIFKYCGQNEKDEFPLVYKDYKFYKEVNDKKIYKQKSFVNFEPELIINVSI